jgi:aspartate beta-hydroxylase
MSVTVSTPGRDEVERHLAAGDLVAARRVSEAWLAAAPGEAEALVVHAAVLMTAGDLEGASEVLAAPAARPDAPFGIVLRYALCRVGLGDDAGARPAFEAALRARPDDAVVRLSLAETLDALGDARAALPLYFRAIMDAQKRGQWLADANTSAPLRDRVKHAMRRVDEGRQALFRQVLEPHVAAFGPDSLRRVADALMLYLGLRPAPPADPRQRPKFFWMPSLPPTAFFDRALFPWYEALEAQAPAIRDEMLARLGEGRDLEPFLGTTDKTVEAQYLAGDATSRAWDAYFFFRHGERFDAHHAACPRTSQALDDVPLTRIRDHAPEVLFSVLAPQSHITPHHGVTNTRVVTHLPLLIPEGDCALVVGGETHRWQEGHCITFDDTFLHEAWNRTGQTRVVMILDTWNPHLEEPERVALKDLVEAIGDFNLTAGIA